MLPQLPLNQESSNPGTDLNKQYAQLKEQYEGKKKQPLDQRAAILRRLTAQ
jgi:hypothetical protein